MSGHFCDSCFIILVKKTICNLTGLMKRNHQTIVNIFCFALLHVFVLNTFSQSHMPDNKMYHLRSTNEPEWTNFSGSAIKQLILYFDAEQYLIETTLKLTQEDVRQNWRIVLN